MPNAKIKIAVVVGSIREKRFAEKPARWIVDLANARGDIEAELVDLKDYPMPHFAEPTSPVWGPSKKEQAQRWQAKLDTFDGYIFTAAEYNHAPSSVLKNAFDYAGPQIFRKPAGFVGYGGVGGARAIEHLRMIAVEMQMAPVKAGVHILWPDYVTIQGGAAIETLDHLNQAGKALLEDIAWWSKALRDARTSELKAQAA